MTAALTRSNCISISVQPGRELSKCQWSRLHSRPLRLFRANGTATGKLRRPKPTALFWSAARSGHLDLPSANGDV